METQIGMPIQRDATYRIIDAVPSVWHQLVVLLLECPIARPGRPKRVHLQASGLPEP